MFIEPVFEIIDVFKYERPDKFAWLIANKLADRLEINKNELYILLKNRKKDLFWVFIVYGIVLEARQA